MKCCICKTKDTLVTKIKLIVSKIIAWVQSKI